MADESAADAVRRRVIPPIAATAPGQSSGDDIDATIDDVTKLMTACHAEDEDDVREMLMPPEDTEDLHDYRRDTVLAGEVSVSISISEVRR
jgi:hypothetical protein